MKTRRSRNTLLVCVLTGVAAIASASFVESGIYVVYNASDSVPRGWYRITTSTDLDVNDIVLAWLPAYVTTLAGERGYLPTGMPILKRIGAVSAQRVCVRNNRIEVDSVAVADVRTVDGIGRPLFAWSHCRRLRDGEVFLLSATNPASFDSRYFGPIHVDAVIGSAQPLWTW